MRSEVKASIRDRRSYPLLPQHLLVVLVGVQLVEDRLALVRRAGRVCLLPQPGDVRVLAVAQRREPVGQLVVGLTASR